MNLDDVLIDEDAGGVWEEVAIIPSGGFDPAGPTFTPFGVDAGIYVFRYLGPVFFPCEQDTAIITINVENQFSAGLDSTIQSCNIPGTTFNLNDLLNGNEILGIWEEITSSGQFDALTGVFDVSDLPEATYNFIYVVNSTDPCLPDTANFSVEVSAVPTINAGADEDICVGDEITLTGSGAGTGGTYSWDNGVTDGIAFTPGATTTYTVVGTTEDGCVNSDEVTITVNTLPEVLFEADKLTGCEPLTVTFESLNPGLSFNWQFGDGTTGTGSPVSHTYISDGTFSVTLTVTSDVGCTASDTYVGYIEVIPQPVASFSYSPSDIFVNNTLVSFTNASSFADHYEWDFGDGSSTTGLTDPNHEFPKSPDQKYTVQLIASNDLGCADTAKRIIFVKDIALFFIPNTFTPDGDNFNEIFKPVFVSGYDPYDYHLKIFNRWGELVFESYNANYGWNGAYGDKGLVQDGVYIWRIEFGETASDKRTKINGHVTVLK